MRRLPRRGLAVALGVLLLGIIAGFRGSGPPKVPTARVSRGPFRNEVVAFGRLHAIKSTPITVPPDLQRPMRIAWLAPAGPVRQGDPVVAFDATEVEKQFEDGRSDRASAESKRRKALVEGRQSRTNLALDRGLAEEQLRRAEDIAATDERIFSRNQIIEDRLDRGLLQNRMATADAKRDLSERLAGADVALADIDRKKADLRIGQAERSLKALQVTAPHDGILVYPLSWRGDAAAVGDTVWPSQTIAELPDLSALEARVFVLEGDGGGLAAGQAARVEVEGQPGVAFEGKLSRVDALAKTRDRQSPVKYFETAISFDASTPEGIKPGQRVRATILVADLADVVAIPRGALFEKDGRRLVYRLEGRRFKAVEVVVGRRSLAKVVIEKGLDANDRIALHDPEQREPAAATPPAGAPPAAAAASR